METLIKLENITKEYKMGEVIVKALNGINLDVSKGEFITIAGPSGSGKTTMLNIIGCLDMPTNGKVYIENDDIHDFNEDHLSDLRNKKIGFIFQSFNLIPVLNVYENIEFPLLIPNKVMEKSKRKELINGLIDSVGLTKYKNQRPNQLSGGQQQRVAIARALVTKPALVLADEPTANLDSENSTNVMQIMKKLNEERKTTFIFSTHDPLVVGYANRVVKIKDGKIIDDGKK